MLAAFRTTARASALSKHTPTFARAYATVEAGTPASAVPAVASEAAVAEALATPVPATARRVAAAEGAQRPHLGVPVKPDHGLYAFFRRLAPADGGAARFETLEPGIPSATDSGRAWTAPELRRKNLRDLHTLWYVVLRERNLLASQREEARRMGIANTNALAVPVKTAHCRKTMARIKYVLNERRRAYAGALVAQAEDRERAFATAAATHERNTFRSAAYQRALARKTGAAAQAAEETEMAASAAA